MKRELKFRIWLKEQYEFSSLDVPYKMIYPDSDDKYDILVIAITNGEPMRLDAGIITDYPYNVMQYMNYRDKNNKDVYEDDIVKINRINESTGNQWSEIIVIDYRKFDFWGDMLCRFVDLEVIGNIHENPNLISENL